MSDADQSTPSPFPSRPPLTLPGGALLGLRARTSSELETALRQGLSLGCLARLRRHLELPLAAGLELVDLTAPAYRALKRTGRPLDPPTSQRLYDLARLTETAELFFGDRAAAHQWLLTPRASLGNRSPLATARRPGGATQIQDILHRLEHGVYT